MDRIPLASPAPRSGDPSAAEIQSAAAHGTSGHASALPYAPILRRAFGSHEVESIHAYTGPSASEGARRMNARAFTTAKGVAFDGPPDLHTAAHEAAHAIQQRAGVRLADRVGRVGDAYERHADAVADLVVRNRSAESLLDRVAPRRERASPPSTPVVQRKIGFEFESGKNLFTPPLGRKEVVYEDEDLTLEADGPGTHMEFVTKPFEAPDKILQAVGAASALARQIVAESEDGKKEVTREKKDP